MSNLADTPRDPRSLNADEAERLLTGWGHKSYRVTQLLGWLYKKRADSIDAMSDLPQGLRDQLADEFSLRPLELAREQSSRDGTVKFLWRLPDGELIESVLIPASIGRDGSQSNRRTLCVSSQVGCAYGCTFCASGLMGYKRNLAASEIVDQVLAVERWRLAKGVDSHRPEPLVNNIVMMGMGEPLANYDNLIRALEIFNSPWGLNIGARKITVSTSGLAPQIRRLAETPQQYHLAISLHGATDAVRDKIMPVNRKYPLEELISACEAYQQAKGRMIWVEYILIDGVNTGPEQVEALSCLAKRLQCKVNLIPYNPVDGIELKRPSDETVARFRDGLHHLGVRVTVRTEKGTDIDAACGQLRLKSEKKPAPSQALGQAG
ncbi:MAG: 23S rRNA (adenine(2503)-C(2))-methyltransferase RlmN [Verrucomicrobiales bacterium]|jgi:23S rRNA (adenine2503-C2)-methyltransferase|nr:23S rRNA (adenine(2503)-C(2))-methyltransferase RlmN [Verrucomicrobiales bacterium]MDP6678688.1 23S rRNA (adenine(2503)-C(2))-methyltransferase RlmN [Verrucomicrobiota bacterium]MDP6753700.1 23S rRNA (adenine(2503)-C(2))-methyltransferase RlmN [Verrucomicrobiota bacterium]MDP7013104.1 23S rRNA (adenine(2503)-C(2))-methyltransferase RlmN [Verrucomicrobiota bacterium]